MTQEKQEPGPSKERAEWGIVDPALDAVKWFGKHLEFGSGPVHCVRLPDHPNASPEHSVLLAIVGNGPRSEANAKRIVELWNRTPPAKSEEEVRAEVWEEAARLHRAKYPVKVRVGVTPRPSMWGRSLADKYERRAKALRSKPARQENNLRPSQSETQSADDSVPVTSGQTVKSNAGVSHGALTPCEIQMPTPHEPAKDAGKP